MVLVVLKNMVVDMGAEKYLTNRGKGQPVQIPVELCDWETLINGLESALNDLEKGKTTDVGGKQTYKFYREALENIQDF